MPVWAALTGVSSTVHASCHFTFCPTEATLEETITEQAPVATVELVAERPEEVELKFIKPVAPELKTVADQELRLE